MFYKREEISIYINGVDIPNKWNTEISGSNLLINFNTGLPFTRSYIQADLVTTTELGYIVTGGDEFGEVENMQKNYD